MEHFLLEKKVVKQVVAPVDLNTAAVTGNRVDLKDAKRATFILSMGASTGATVEVTLKQHNAATAGTSKVLEVDNKWYKKVGAATSFTKVEPSVAASLFDLSADFAAAAGIVVIEVLPEDLDVNGDFSHVSVDIADSGAAKLASCICVVESKIAPAHSVEV